MTRTLYATIAIVSLLMGGCFSGCRCHASDQNADALSKALVEAAESGDAGQVQRLLAQRPDRRIINKALFVAAQSSPLILAPPSGKVASEAGAAFARAVALLLENGATMEARDERGDTPLIAAARHGETEVVSLLLAKGAAIEDRNNSGETPLIAAACLCPIIDQPDTFDSVRLLLDHRADIEAHNKDGDTPLIAAAAWGRTHIVRLLLDRSAKIDARNGQGNTALLVAAAGGALPTADAVQLLLARGADLAARNNNLDTALTLAAAKGGYEDLKIVGMLLKSGANLSARNKQGSTALDLAQKICRTEIAAVLKTAITNLDDK